MSLLGHLKNREDSGKAMLMLVEFDEDNQTIIPSAPTAGELCKWKNTKLLKLNNLYFEVLGG